ncbi:hypothetical protein [Helicobacter pylori]|uniref:hypothetical protein n=1 Tax=Helicobacter pylori TaxID=210 RepID=UPI001BB40ED8|nr:hypothetical protein [Helicobacter pylori]
MVSNTNDFRGVFGEVLDTVKDTFGNLLQLLTNLKNKEIEFDFHKKINYGLPFGIIFITSNSDNPKFLTNFKNSKIPNEKISFSPPKDYPSLYKAYGYFKREVRDTGLIKTIYGCIDDENAFLELENDKTINDLNLQDLLGQLKTQAFPLSDIITNAINQKERVALDYALINDIKYNLLDNTFHFIFDIDLHLIDD